MFLQKALTIHMVSEGNVAVATANEQWGASPWRLHWLVSVDPRMARHCLSKDMVAAKSLKLESLSTTCVDRLRFLW